MNLSIYAINYTKEGMSQVYDTPSLVIGRTFFTADFKSAGCLAEDKSAGRMARLHSWRHLGTLGAFSPTSSVIIRTYDTTSCISNNFF